MTPAAARPAVPFRLGWLLLMAMSVPWWVGAWTIVRWALGAPL